MKHLLIVALMFLAACAPPPGMVNTVSTSGTPVSGQSDIRYYHDDLHGVSCWIVGLDAGISCIRDLDVANIGR